MLFRSRTEAACVTRAAGTWEEHTHRFSKEPTDQMERQDRHPRTLKSPLRAATITSQNKHSAVPCEAVSTAIRVTIYEGLSRVWFYFISVTSLFLIPPLSPTRRWRPRGLRDAPKDTDQRRGSAASPPCGWVYLGSCFSGAAAPPPYLGS